MSVKGHMSVRMVCKKIKMDFFLKLVGGFWWLLEERNACTDLIYMT